MKKVFLLGILFHMSVFARNSGKTIAVTEFNQDVESWYDSCQRWNGWNSHNQLKTALEKSLSTAGLRVMERQHIQKMYNDEFQMENLDPKTKATEKKFIAAKYAVTGAVVEMGICEEETGTGLQLGGIVSLLGGPSTDAAIHVGGGVSKVKLAAKLIEVRTGEVIKTFESETESSEKSLGLSGSMLGIGAEHQRTKTPPIERAMNEGLDKIAKDIAAFLG